MTKQKATMVVRSCLQAEDEQRVGCHCEHGHVDCSYTPGGECFDEACGVLGEDALAEVTYKVIDEKVKAARRLGL